MSFLEDLGLKNKSQEEIPPVPTEPVPLPETPPVEPVKPTESVEPVEPPKEVPPEPPAEPPEPTEPPTEPDEPAPEESVDTLRAQRDILMEELRRATGVQKPVTPAQPVQPPAPAPAPEEFIKTDDEFEEVLNDRSKFNATMNKIYEAGRQSILVSLPSLVEPFIAERVDIVTKVNSFYKDNPDLKPFMAFVGTVANELQGKHPDYPLDKLLSETESEARKRLKMTRVNKVARPAAPAFAPPPTPKKSTVDNRGDVTKDIDSMLKTL